MVVDDEHAARRALGWLLSDAGLSVTAAANGEDALRDLAVERYDVLLTDIRMPGIDGVDLMRRAQVLDRDLSVVLMTAYAEVHTAVRAMSEGAFWYVTKPVEVDALLDVIGRALELCALRVQSAEGSGAQRSQGVNEAPTVPGATLSAIERHAILTTVHASHGDLTEAARVLGVGVPFLASRLRRYDEA